jgi:hypothetical protein
MLKLWMKVTILSSSFLAAGLTGGPLQGTALASTVTLKPQLVGLLNEGRFPTAAYQSLISGMSVDAKWSSLQPTAGGPIAANNNIDKTIASVRQYNLTTTGPQLRLKLRVLAGLDAPDWVKNLDGPPVSATEGLTGTIGTVGRFWTANFASAYQDLQNKLAALYDSVPEISEIVASRCTTFTAEPFIRDTSVQTNVTNLLAAGFTTAADEQCIQDQFTEHLVWTHTRTGVAFSPYQVINANGTTALDMVFPQQMILACRAVLAQQCVVENDFLTSTGAADALGIAMAIAGSPNALQTAQCRLVGSVTGAAQNAVVRGSHAVELCLGYESYATPTQLAPFPSTLPTATYTPLPPQAITGPGQPTDATSLSVTGQVNPNGLSTTVSFQYGTTTAYGLTTTAQSAGSLVALSPVSRTLSGLVSGTVYHFRTVAVNAAGTTYGSDRTATTPLLPTATTGGATTPAPGQLTLAGTVDPRGSATTYYFEFGTTTSYGTTTPVTSAGSGNSPVPVSAVASGLLTGVVYHYRVVAQNPSGVAKGGDRFQLTPQAPAANTQSATSPGSGQLTLTGTVGPHGSATTYYFQYGTDTGYGMVTASASAGSGTTLIAVNAVISGLLPGITYHYRLVAQNPYGIAAGVDRYRLAV